MDEHRVPMLGGAWRRHSDPLRSADPRVREIIGALAALPVAPEPRPDFRAELRAQLVAVAPRLVAEGELTPAGEPRAVAAAPKPRAEQRRTERFPVEQPSTEPPAARRRWRLAKPLIAAACVLGAFVLLLGGAVLISRHALPGDVLYGVKRASEDTEYSLAGGAVDRGKLKLEFAARRIGEVGDLLPRASAMAPGTGAVADGGINAGTAGLIRDTLGSANGDIQTAAQLLGGAAVRSGDHAPLAAITSWVPDQLGAMRSITARIPGGGLHRAAEQTLTWLRAAQLRAQRLGADLGCSCLDPANTDALGPRPCAGPCSSATPGRRHHKTAPTTRTRNRHGHPSGRTVVPGGTVPPAGTTVPGRSTAPTTTAPAANRHHRSPAPVGPPPAPPTTVTTPVLPVPSIPGLIGGGGSSTGSGKGSTGVPLPISVSSSCVRLSAGAIQIGVGNC